MTLGLRHGEVVLVPHSRTWQTAFEAERSRLFHVVGEWTSHIEHVGSTAVPGLAAKPVIDICLGVEALADADSMAEAMASLGYDYPGDVGIPDDRVFGRDADRRTHLVHLVVWRGQRWSDYIRFRDALRGDEALRSEYEELKHRLAIAHCRDRGKYTQEKAGFIERILAVGEPHE